MVLEKPDFRTLWDFESDKVLGNTTLYANWTLKKYDVNFDSNGGDLVAKVNAGYDTTITAPTEPSKPNYEFAGWYKEADFRTLWDFESDNVLGNTTLYANWTLKKYDVNFDSNGGDLVAKVNVGYGTAITAPTEPSKPNYEFAGWYKEADFTTLWIFGTDKVLGDTTLYANWTLKKYDVNFDSNGGDLVVKVNVGYGTAITAPTEPSKANYEFAGWYKEADFATLWNFGSDKVLGNTMLYVKWTPINYTVSFAVSMVVK